MGLKVGSGELKLAKNFCACQIFSIYYSLHDDRQHLHTCITKYVLYLVIKGILLGKQNHFKLFYDRDCGTTVDNKPSSFR